ncbi:MAG TPA: PDR/VanB family oxidoreductase [Pseudolabrys sp.]|nr:PDR/VanB family oxidoreductase [Pseudolabrys sp.]
MAKQEQQPKPVQPHGRARLQVFVRAVTRQGEDINAYEVVDPAGKLLPAFEAGSHIDVDVPGEAGLVRQYSLCGDPEDRSRYLFAVQREPGGRGGSKAIHERVHVNSTLTISEPRNNFALRPSARRHLLLAGGIGITPMMAMLRHLQRTGAEYTLHYCTRSPSRTAFLDILQPFIAEGRVSIHWDNGNPADGLDVKATLSAYGEGTHLYYCGPPGFMGAVAAASAHWPSGTTHREFFTPSANDPAIPSQSPAEPAAAQTELGSKFQVRLARSGQTLDIPEDKTILQVLRENDVSVETSCELGVCGTCRTRVLEGQPDHRDFVLEAQEQQSEMTVCCSRSKTPLIVLDL